MQPSVNKESPTELSHSTDSILCERSSGKAIESKYDAATGKLEYRCPRCGQSYYELDPATGRCRICGKVTELIWKPKNGDDPSVSTSELKAISIEAPPSRRSGAKVRKKPIKASTHGEQVLPVKEVIQHEPLPSPERVLPSASPQNENTQEIFEGDPFEDETWIKLYRKFRKNPVYKDSMAVHLFVHLLLAANHKPNRFIFNEKEITVKRGQLITGRKQLSSETGIGESTVKRRLKLFEKLGMLTIKPTNKFSILTLCNYKHYQESNFEKRPAVRTTVDGSQKTIKRPASDQQVTTNKKYKNVRSKKHYVEGSTELRLASLLLEEIRKNKPNLKQPNLQVWARDIDLLLRRDNRSVEAIERVIRWAQADHGNGTGDWKGWAAVILSPGKLRDKFDELEVRMRGAKPSGKSW